MMKMSTMTTLGTTLATTLAVASTATAGGSCTGNQQRDIVTTAQQAGSFETLATALTAAGLVDALQGPGPFTVFAPTDEAFSKLPRGTVEALLEPANKARLAAILTYHVLPERVSADSIARRSAAVTLNGQQVDVRVDGNAVRIDDARVTRTDILCDNGIIHVIDQVILPTEDDLVDIARSNGSFKTLTAALGAAGLVDALGGTGPFTVFAPTDAAFARLPAGTVERLLEPANRDELAAILKYHVLPGRVFANQAIDVPSATTLQGEDVSIRFAAGRLTVNEATVVTGDIDASNGVIHVIDRVILPPAAASSRVPLDAAGVIELAINRGAALFNAGQHAACSAVYEMTATSLVSFDGSLSQGNRQRLHRALTRMHSTHDASDQAWIMRHALDDVYRVIASGQ